MLLLLSLARPAPGTAAPGAALVAVVQCEAAQRPAKRPADDPTGPFPEEEGRPSTTEHDHCDIVTKCARSDECANASRWE